MDANSSNTSVTSSTAVVTDSSELSPDEKGIYYRTYSQVTNDIEAEEI